MKCSLLLIIFCIVANLVNSQTLTPSVTPSAGGTFAPTGKPSLSWTLGEPLHQSLVNGSYLLTQGEQQPYITVKLLSLKAYIQGFYSSLNTLNAIVDPVTNPTQCDTITLEIRKATAPYSIICSVTSLIGTNGSAIFNVPGLIGGLSYYWVVKHRNSIETWSAAPVKITAGVLYDFTSSDSKAYGGNEVSLGDGNFAIWNGDINRDGLIDLSDLSILQIAADGFQNGYVLSDLTGDRIVESADFSFIENNLPFNVSVIRP